MGGDRDFSVRDLHFIQLYRPDHIAYRRPDTVAYSWSVNQIDQGHRSKIGLAETELQDTRVTVVALSKKGTDLFAAL